MIAKYFGLIEALGVFALIFGFYLWQMSDLKKAAARRDAEKAAGTFVDGADLVSDANDTPDDDAKA